MMCEIAEGERKRLYYESQTEKAVSQSQPTSPLRGKLEILISDYASLEEDTSRVRKVREGVLFSLVFTSGHHNNHQSEYSLTLTWSVMTSDFCRWANEKYFPRSGA